MDIRVLKYFLAAAKEENITRAAESLHIAQPSLSKQLIELEQELGSKLLIRGKRKISLTEEGRLLKRRAEEIVSLVEKTEHEITNGQKKVSGKISIGRTGMTPMNFTAEIISHIHSLHPEIRYYFHTAPTEELLKQLGNGMLDFALLIPPP